MTYFYEYIPNIPELPIYIVEADNWKEANRIFKLTQNVTFKEQNNFGFIWMAQNKESPNFKVPTHLEQYPIESLESTKDKLYNEFKILYLDNCIKTLKKEL